MISASNPLINDLIVEKVTFSVDKSGIDASTTVDITNNVHNFLNFLSGENKSFSNAETDEDFSNDFDKYLKGRDENFNGGSNSPDYGMDEDEKSMLESTELGVFIFQQADYSDFFFDAISKLSFSYDPDSIEHANVLQEEVYEFSSVSKNEYINLYYERWCVKKGRIFEEETYHFLDSQPKSYIFKSTEDEEAEEAGIIIPRL